MSEIPKPSDVNRGSETPEEKGDNPNAFFARFYNSPDIQKLIDDRLRLAQQRDPSVTKEEIWEAISSNPEVKNTFWDFQNKNPYKLDEDQLTPEFRNSLHNYFGQINKVKAKERAGRYIGNQGELKDDDAERSAKHIQATEQLIKEGIVPNITLGRLLVHFMAVSAGKDIPDPSRDERRRAAITKQPTSRRFRRR